MQVSFKGLFSDFLRNIYSKYISIVQCSNPCPDGTYHDHVAAAGAEQPQGLADQLQAVLADRLLAGQDQVGGADRLHPGQDQRHR